jgi:hypothetical protein
MKQPAVAVLVVALLAATVLRDVSAQSSSSLIVAGQSIGQTHLGRFGATYLAKLPKPDADDSGMGKYRSVWLSKNQAGRKDTLYIFSVANDPRDIQPRNGVSIRLIRVTSPWYHTANGISTGNALPQILRSFPGAPTDQGQTLYDDSEQGIAFEFSGRATAGSPCIRDHGSSSWRSEFDDREGCQRHPSRKWHPTLANLYRSQILRDL